MDSYYHIMNYSKFRLLYYFQVFFFTSFCLAQNI